MEKKLYPRRLLPHGWTIELVNKTGYVTTEQPIGEVHNLTGETFQLCADTAHEQLVYQRSDGQILRRPASARMTFFHDQTPVEALEPSIEDIGPFSKKLYVKTNKPTFKIPKAPQSFKLKP